MHVVVSVKKPMRWASRLWIAISVTTPRSRTPARRSVVSLPSRRPGCTWHANVLSSIETLGSPDIGDEVVGRIAGDAERAGRVATPVPWKRDLVDGAASNRSGRSRRVTFARASISPRSVSIVIHPPS